VVDRRYRQRGPESFSLIGSLFQTSRPSDSFDCAYRIELQELRKPQELDHVYAALAAFEACDKRLMFTQLFCEAGLGQASRFALCDKQTDQGSMMH
jgi:hypothetical protein